MALSTKSLPVFDEDAATSPEAPAAKKQSFKSTLYPKIFKLSNFVFHIRSSLPDLSPSDTVPIIGTTKLHGTHADIVFASATSSEFRMQSRNQLELKAGVQDNIGFAAFVMSLEKDKGVILRLRDRFVERYRELNPNIVVAGEVIVAAEWCGLGIQKKVAISKVPRFMAIISVFINGSWVPDWDYRDIEDVESRIFNIGRFCYFIHELRLDNDGLRASEAEIMRVTNEVERECPFAKQVCGESGPGEGIVWKALNHSGDPKHWFKSKGDGHAVSNISKMPASAVDRDNRERVTNFARAVVTENRLEQGWDLLEQKTISSLGVFLKWVIEDCLVEEELEMEYLEISKNKLGPVVVSIAKPWFVKRLAYQ